MLTLAVEAGNINCLVLERPGPQVNELTQRRETKSVKTFSQGGLRCRERLRQQLLLRFPSEDINEVKALLLGSRIKVKAVSIVSDSGGFAQAEQELQLEHCTINKRLFSRDARDEECKETIPDPPTMAADAQWTSISAIAVLLELDAPPANVEVIAAHNDLEIEAMNAWNQWRNLSVPWASVGSTKDKYNLLQLYREVDILQWCREHGTGNFSAIAVLARIYLAKPLSTAAQERIFQPEWLRGERVANLA